MLDASRLPEVTSASSEDTSSDDEDGDCKDRDLFALHLTRHGHDVVHTDQVVKAPSYGCMDSDKFSGKKEGG